MPKQWFITSVVLIAIGLGAGWWLRGYLHAPDSPPSTPPPEVATVRKIIDGITIELDSGHHVRYLGVRTPTVANEVQCFGKEAIAANESIINKKVRLEEDPVLTRARDGAWIRYVYLVPSPPAVSASPTPSSSPTPEKEEGETISPEPSVTPVLTEEPTEIFINERILEGGFGFPVVSQDMRYGEQMLSAARYASATGKGLWSRCTVTDKEGQPVTQNVTECTIKGVVGRDLSKIYRTSECPGYRQTIVVESQGGRWFCAEDIAKNEGWQKASDCPK